MAFQQSVLELIPWSISTLMSGMTIITTMIIITIIIHARYIGISITGNWVDYWSSVSVVDGYD